MSLVALRGLCKCIFLPNLSRSSHYTSAISLKNLYPDSSLKLTTPKPDQVPGKDGEFNGFIPIDQLEITYSTSSGPGGQNVNKVNTKVDLRLKVESAKWLGDNVRQKLIEINKNKLTKEGYLVIRSEKTRSQQLNLADAMERLRSIIWKAVEPEHEPSEETVERIRRRAESANRKRLVDKKMKSFIKSDRQAPTI
ncbi:peptidyl-tRNA hydrolase ICT1, mitochondrial [Adelges cooleyi]|uniref:peptidyl-tRNA hydrolase ICT1, mitochondrial n=1 Tax=Adelges cooleyi TaxID=133065 RepID=UPI00218016A8|nr:peptidyl-tRNA hydrolase ICT1, mitochondrial [Adelges cooleyi]